MIDLVPVSAEQVDVTCVCESCVSFCLIKLNDIFLESVTAADVSFVCELLPCWLSPRLICERGAWQQCLERLDMLTNLFCYFGDNTHKFLLNIKAPTVLTAELKPTAA